MLFKSQVDWWYYLIIGAVVIILAISTVPAIQQGKLNLLWAGFIWLLSLGLPLWLLLNTNYQVTKDSLLIRSGPFKWVVPLGDIHSANLTRSNWSAPALSLNRIELSYGNGKRILVSPKDRAAFLEAIGHSNSGS